ncbi:GNAT family N-acetyltransferase [Chelativorans sp. AA-79]|uniref:GNAT family N-acetyltransferase n=1 Tax=Chelativorans sp. AA-79 TaxID=3028735 RepID=UPI0023F83698|nr:GNAT family N-acetyltransferase [Chelativorans sp. AA-79]WEX08139.1 GNAT family N-acetyltransferase [Chelativorans sp. AA-79]
MRADPAAAVALADIPAGYGIRPYARDDAAALAAVETRASRLFAEHGFPSLVPDPPTTAAAFHSFVTKFETVVSTHAGQDPVGYAVLHPLDRFLHLRELAVDPAHGRRGLGSALVRFAIARSVEEKCAGVSLTTFRDLPFNRPFYAAHGFVECPLDEAPPPLARQFFRELPSGIAPETRLLMLRRNLLARS